MKPYSGFEPKLSGQSKQKLPAGGYVARIKDGFIEKTKYGDRLAIEFDIAEGEYAGYYQADYERSANSQYGQKWRGVYRAYVPDDSGTGSDNFNKNIMNNVIASILSSNPSYKWNWDERTLKNLVVGVLMREREYEFENGKRWGVECFKLTDANAIRSGNFEVPPPRTLRRNSAINNNRQYEASFEMPPLPTDADAPINTYNYRGVQTNQFDNNGSKNGNVTVQTNTPDGFGNGWMGSNEKLPWET